MYRLIGILCVFLLFQEQETIDWNAQEKLHWGNFKGEPDYDSDAVAITASGITYGLQVKTFSNSDEIEYKTTVVAQFYPNESWYLSGSVNDTILAHEQLHFDISELHARKFRKRIKQATFTKNIQKEIAKIYDQINKELRKMQEAYDEGSDYSREYSGQITWQEYIANELKKYDQFQ